MRKMKRLFTNGGECKGLILSLRNFFKLIYEEGKNASMSVGIMLKIMIIQWNK
jgi:hypothetical protein